MDLEPVVALLRSIAQEIVVNTHVQMELSLQLVRANVLCAVLVNIVPMDQKEVAELTWLVLLAKTLTLVVFGFQVM